MNVARKVRREPLIVTLPEPETRVETSLGTLAADELAVAMSRLSDRQRLVLFLRYYADLDYATIADALSISSGTVGATLTAARAALGQALAMQEATPCLIRSLKHLRGSFQPSPRSKATGRRSVIALAVLALLTAGIAWAAGAFKSQTPRTLFESHSPADSGSGPIWAGFVHSKSVKQVASVEIPKFGPVALWHADTTHGGFCLGLRLSDGAWLDTPPQAGGSTLDSGGAVPGCFPLGVIDHGNEHMEWLENDVDAHSVGGTFAPA